MSRFHDARDETCFRYEGIGASSVVDGRDLKDSLHFNCNSFPTAVMPTSTCKSTSAEILFQKIVDSIDTGDNDLSLNSFEVNYPG